jgi:hypothetical protein
MQDFHRNCIGISQKLVQFHMKTQDLRKIPTIQRRQTDKQNQFLIKTNRAIES